MEILPRTPELERAFAEARQLTKAHGSSYYASTLLFPASTREAVFGLYGLVRKADDIVDADSSQSKEAALVELNAFEAQWREAYRDGYSSNAILYAAAWVFRTYDIPFAYSEAFFAAMRSDTHTFRYATYTDLETYMYGSAGVIGYMLTRVIGTVNASSDAPACALGYAMQLTNFLRDINEDYAERGRIYLPQEDLERFGVTEAMIAAGRVTPEFKQLMKFEIARARQLYTESDRGIAMLNSSGRKPVRLARVLYSKILDRIEEADYDVFSERRYTTKLQKLRYALPILISI